MPGCWCATGCVGLSWANLWRPGMPKNMAKPWKKPSVSVCFCRLGKAHIRKLHVALVIQEQIFLKCTVRHSADLNREIGLLNLMNTPEHCSAPFHSVSSKAAKSTKMAAAHIQTYVLRVTWSILYTYLITPPEPVRRHGESKCFELGEF